MKQGLIFQMGPFALHGVDRGVNFLFYKSMVGPIQIFPVRERLEGWEVPAMIGSSESNGVGFLIKIEKEYWGSLTGGVCSPERLTRITLDFLLRKKGSAFLLEREIIVRDLSKEFPDYEEQVRKKLIGAFGL